MKEIASLSNPSVRRMANYLEKSRERKKDAVFVAEGLRENARAIAAGYELLELYFDKNLVEAHLLESLLEAPLSRPLLNSCTSEVFAKMAYRTSVPNVVGLYRQKKKSLADIFPASGEMILVAESIEKPGNLGAVLRSSDAVGVKTVLVCDSMVDIHHPNVLRNSLGGFFDQNVISCTSEEAISFLRAHNIPIVVTCLEGEQAHYNTPLTGSLAVVLGSESHGISDVWKDAADHLVKIPMSGLVDSLNVSVAAAVLLFEANRQRNQI